MTHPYAKFKGVDVAHRRAKAFVGKASGGAAIRDKLEDTETGERIQDAIKTEYHGLNQDYKTKHHPQGGYERPEPDTPSQEHQYEDPYGLLSNKKKV